MVLGGPAVFREVREVKRNNAHQFSKNVSGGFQAVTKKRKNNYQETATVSM